MVRSTTWQTFADPLGWPTCSYHFLSLLHFSSLLMISCLFHHRHHQNHHQNHHDHHFVLLLRLLPLLLSFLLFLRDLLHHHHQTASESYIFARDACVMFCTGLPSMEEGEERKDLCRSGLNGVAIQCGLNHALKRPWLRSKENTVNCWVWSSGFGVPIPFWSVLTAVAVVSQVIKFAWYACWVTAGTTWAMRNACIHLGCVMRCYV